MYDLIQQKVDYIILQPIVETGWEDAIHAAEEAGIPVIVADRKIAVDETEYVSWIGSDFEEEGRKAVTWLDQYLTEQGRETRQSTLSCWKELKELPLPSEERTVFYMEWRNIRTGLS